MPDTFVVIFLDVPPGSGWQERAEGFGEANHAYKTMADMIDAGGNETAHPSGVLIEGTAVFEKMDWDKAMSYHYLWSNMRWDAL